MVQYPVHTTPTDLEIRQARDQLWQAGDLIWKLNTTQRNIYNYFHSNKNKTIVINASRRLGKSYVLLTIALEMCIKKPKTIIKYIQPTRDMIKTNLNPDLEAMLEDCPLDLRPTYKQIGNVWEFQNGSKIHIAGTDGKNYNKLRGGKADLCIIDEAGFCSDLSHIINSILTPLTTHSGGRIILSSTTPTEPDHEFNNYMDLAEQNDAFIRKTIIDAIQECENDTVLRLTKEKMADIVAAIPGGINSDSFRTEYLCQKVFNSSDSVLPEWTDEIQKHCIVPRARPAFCDRYVAMDIGFVDLTVVLFAYWDYDHGVLVIEDEYVQKQGTTTQLAVNIKRKEDELWTNPITGEQEPPYKRVSDNNLIVINDLQMEHRMFFQATEKHDKLTYLSILRTMIEQRQVFINPRCKTLISHMKSATWNKDKKDFKRSPDNGHYDACFTEDAKVLTSKGYKKISEVEIGDLVLTHNNRFKKVLATMSKNYEGELIKIKPVGREEITCTPEHNFYAAECYKSHKNGFTGQQKLKEPNWIEANYLDKHKLYIPTIPNTNEIVMTKEMAFLYGYYVAEGSLGGNGHQINFAGHVKEKNVIDILTKAVSETYGLGHPGTSRRSIRRHLLGQCKPRSVVPRFYAKGGNTRTINITQSELYKELRQLGKSTTKNFPTTINELSFDQSLYMIAGYLFGDAHFSKVGMKSSTISESIKNGIDLLLRKLGFTPNIRHQIRKKGKSQWEISLDKQQTIQLLSLMLNKEDLNFVYQDKLIHNIISKHEYHNSSNFKKFKKTLIKTSGCRVYNLEVEDDNSYTVNGVAVHNCAALLYLSRNLDKTRNPYPSGYRYSRMGDPSNLFIRDQDKVNETNERLHKEISRMFSGTSSFNKRKSIK